MRTAIIGFALGVLIVQWSAVLPGIGIRWAGAILLGLLLVGNLASSERQRRSTAIAGPRGSLVVLALTGLLCGAGWATLRAEWRLADALPMEWEGRPILVTGIVGALPQAADPGVRFVLDVESASAPVPGRIELAWYPPRSGGSVPVIAPGARWQLVVHLRRPHGFVNPGGFDYEAWLLERNVRATGSVRDCPQATARCIGANQQIDRFVPGFMSAIHRLRSAVRERFSAQLGQAPFRGVLIALAVGDQRAITQDQWQVFRRTGTAHLVSISGLHVSLVALATGALTGWLWRRSTDRILRCPVRVAAAVGGLAGAGCYALLAGLGLPTQRAFLMLAVAAAGLALKRDVAVSHTLALALFVVLLFDPWAVLAAGFWLSFVAVGAILLVLCGRNERGPSGSPGWLARTLRGMGSAARVQGAITLATVPPLVLLFNAFPLVSPLANAFAIPLVSFVVTPLALSAIVLPHPQLLALAHEATVLLFSALDRLAAWPQALWAQATPPAAGSVVAAVAVVWLLLPRGTPGRAAALLACLALLGWKPGRPYEGGFRVTVLDVGQGTAVHVQTAAHDLLYDAGPRYGRSGNAGERVLRPYFAAAGVERLDWLVLSHGDADHTGGAQAVLAAMPVNEILSSLGPDHELVAGGRVFTDCVAGQSWESDAVRFEFLHPAPPVDVPAQAQPQPQPPVRAAPSAMRGNDRSCVLRISSIHGSVLLTGDIGARAEASLIASHPRHALASDVVLVPHHGSRSSSSPAFVEATAAHHAVHSVGNLNPFRHPHPSVWARWQAAGARQWRTDAQGAVRIEVGVEGISVEAERLRSPRYWHGR